jgi:type I restriction enzyme S subunit
MYTLKGKHFLTYVNSKVGGMKMPRLGTTDGKMALIPLAPVEEQKAIVEKVEMLMQKRQALEEEIKTSEANAQMLMQAVLKEAFEGKKEEAYES